MQSRGRVRQSLLSVRCRREGGARPGSARRPDAHHLAPKAHGPYFLLSFGLFSKVLGRPRVLARVPQRNRTHHRVRFVAWKPLTRRGGRPGSGSADSPRKLGEPVARVQPSTQTEEQEDRCLSCLATRPRLAAQDPERACVSVKVQKEKKSPSPSSRTVRQEECSVTPWRACL